MEPCGTFNTGYEQDVAVVRTRLQWGLTIFFFVVLFCLPFLPGVSRTMLSWIILTSIILISVFGLNLLTGYCGQISLGQSAFMAVGGYTSALSMIYLDCPFLLALLVGGVVAAVAGLLFGLPAARIKGFYLAMSTIAAQFIILYVLTHLPKEFAGGSEGRDAPFAQIGSILFSDDHSFYFLAISLAIIMGLLARNLVRTKTGRAFVAIRDNDLAAEVLGIHVTNYKLLAFAICSFYAGISGALWTHYIAYISPEQFSLMSSVWYLGMLIVGGMGSTMGAIFGVAGLRGLEELTGRFAPALSEMFPGMAGLSASLAILVYAVVILVFLILEPRGINHRWEVFRNWYRLWPFSY